MTTTYTVPVPETPELDDPIRSCLQIFLLPSWIFNAFTAKHNLMEIHNYGKLRGVVSVTDLAHLEVIRTSLFKKSQIAHLNEKDLGYTLRSLVNDGYYFSVSEALTESQRAEIEGTVNYLTMQPEVIEEAISRLKKVESNELGCEAIAACDNYWKLLDSKTESEEPLYRIVNSQDKLYIIVEEGFLSQLENKVNLKAFLTQVLKSAYAIAPIPVVNSSLWYMQYLNVLADKA